MMHHLDQNDSGNILFPFMFLRISTAQQSPKVSNQDPRLRKAFFCNLHCAERDALMNWALQCCREFGYVSASRVQIFPLLLMRYWRCTDAILAMRVIILHRDALLAMSPTN